MLEENSKEKMRGITVKSDFRQFLRITQYLQGLQTLCRYV